MTFWDSGTQEWNMDAFSNYIFGPNRNAIFSGLNQDGTPFSSELSSESPLHMGFNPAPLYFALPNKDVESFPTNIYNSKRTVGWSMLTDSSYFKATKSPNSDDKGSMQLVVEERTSVPSFRNKMHIRFESFQCECLLWGFGTSVSIDISATESMHFFAQGVRKGYSDSRITEIAFVENDIGADDNRFKV